jgi:ribosomal protein S18 acetylase RimI-like enzyme
MDRRQRRLDKNGAFIQFPGKGEGNYAILDALWRITTTRHGDIDPTTNSWRQKPESDRAGLANPWDVAVMTAYIDSTGVHGEVHKLTPQNTRETVRRVLDDRNDSAEYVPETITGTQVLIGTGSARRELETIAGCRSLQDMAVTRIGTGKFAKDRTILNESTVETGAIDTETWQNIKEKIISLKNAQSRDHAFTPEELEKHFTDSDNAVALIKYKNEIIGYSYAMPTTQAYSENDPVFSGRVKDSTTAYLYNVVIDPRYQGRGLVGKLSSALEDKLREKGYTHLEMDAAIQNGYANSIQKAYGARVIVSHDHPSIYGEQRYFLLDIQRQPSQDKISYVIPKSQSQGDKTHAFTFAHANESQAWGEMPSLHRGANIQLGEHLYRITYMRDGTMTAQRMDPKTNTKINDAPKNLSYVRDQETGSVVVTMIDTKEANRKHLALQLQQAANRQSGLDTQFSRN